MGITRYIPAIYTTLYTCTLCLPGGYPTPNPIGYLVDDEGTGAAPEAEVPVRLGLGLGLDERKGTHWPWCKRKSTGFGGAEQH